MRRLRRRHLPADGDVPLPIGDPPTAESVTARLREAATGSEALTSRDRYQLMLRFSLTQAQIDRTPVDVARTLLATLH